MNAVSRGGGETAFGAVSSHLPARRSCIKLPMLLPGSYVHEGTNGPIMGELPDAGGSKQASATCASPLVRFLPAAQAAGWSKQGETLSGVLTLML